MKKILARVVLANLVAATSLCGILTFGSDYSHLVGYVQIPYEALVLASGSSNTITGIPISYAVNAVGGNTNFTAKVATCSACELHVSTQVQLAEGDIWMYSFDVRNWDLNIYVDSLTSGSTAIVDIDYLKLVR